MASAVDVGNENTSTKFQARANTSVKGDLVVPTSQPDFKEKESNLEDVEEDDNEVEGYQLLG